MTGAPRVRLRRPEDRHRPARHDRGQLLFQPPQPRQRLFDCLERVLEHDLLGRMREALARQPAPVRQGPMLAAIEDAAVPQQKRQQLLALAAKVLSSRLARPNQIAHRLVNGIRHPHCGQLAGAQQPGQGHRIAPIGLDPLARLLRDQRRRHDRAVVAELPNVPVQPVTRWTRLIAKMQLVVALRQLPGQALDPRRRTGDVAEEAHLAASPAIGNRHRVLRLRRVESNIGFAILCHGPPSVHEARLGPPEQPSLLYRTIERTAGLSPGS
jgi:hypothetical protein